MADRDSCCEIPFRTRESGGFGAEGCQLWGKTGHSYRAR
jgi:hypothetical protein